MPALHPSSFPYRRGSFRLHVINPPCPVHPSRSGAAPGGQAGPIPADDRQRCLRHTPQFVDGMLRDRCRSTPSSGRRAPEIVCRSHTSVCSIGGKRGEGLWAHLVAAAVDRLARRDVRLQPFLARGCARRSWRSRPPLRHRLCLCRTLTPGGAEHLLRCCHPTGPSIRHSGGVECPGVSRAVAAPRAARRATLTTSRAM